MIDGGVELVTLYERRSASGRSYMVGLMGKVRVLLLKDDHAELGEGTIAAWNLIVKPRDEARPELRSSKQLRSRRGATSSQPVSAKSTAAPASPPVRARARPAKDNSLTAQDKAIADINARYKSDLNDPIGEL